MVSALRCHKVNWRVMDGIAWAGIRWNGIGYLWRGVGIEHLAVLKMNKGYKAMQSDSMHVAGILVKQCLLGLN